MWLQDWQKRIAEALVNQPGGIAALLLGFVTASAQILLAWLIGLEPSGGLWLLIAITNAGVYLQTDVYNMNRHNLPLQKAHDREKALREAYSSFHAKYVELQGRPNQLEVLDREHQSLQKKVPSIWEA